jgi:hypothetical protein
VELSADGEWLKLDRTEDIFTSWTRPQTKKTKSPSFLSDSDEEDEEDVEEDDDDVEEKWAQGLRGHGSSHYNAEFARREVS